MQTYMRRTHTNGLLDARRQQQHKACDAIVFAEKISFPIFVPTTERTRLFAGIHVVDEIS